MTLAYHKWGILHSKDLYLTYYCCVLKFKLNFRLQIYEIKLNPARLIGMNKTKRVINSIKPNMLSVVKEGSTH